MIGDASCSLGQGRVLVFRPKVEGGLLLYVVLSLAILSSPSPSVFPPPSFLQNLSWRGMPVQADLPPLRCGA